MTELMDDPYYEEEGPHNDPYYEEIPPLIVDPPPPPPPVPKARKKKRPAPLKNKPKKAPPPPPKDLRVRKETVAEDAPDSKLCEICYEVYNKGVFFYLPNCKHEFCVDCTLDHIEAAIQNKLLAIACMMKDCPSRFTVKHLEKLGLEQQLLQRFKQTNEDFKVATSKNIKYCPTPDCDTQVKKPCCHQRAVCPTCTHDVCFRCGKAWHDGTQC